MLLVFDPCKMSFINSPSKKYILCGQHVSQEQSRKHDLSVENDQYLMKTFMVSFNLKEPMKFHYINDLAQETKVFLIILPL